MNERKNKREKFGGFHEFRDQLPEKQLPDLPAPVYLAAAAVLLLLAALILVPWFQNLVYSIQIRKGPVESATEQKLARGGLSDRYVPNYNLGHSAYDAGDYDKAIDYYDQALSYQPKWHRECPVRINLTLSMLREIDYSDKSQTSIDALKEARAVLCADGCADPNGKPGKGGHNKDAIRLRDEIDKVLQDMDQNDQDDQDDKKDDQKDQEQQQEQSGKDDSKKQSMHEKSIENQLKEEQKEAQKQYNQDKQEEQQQQEMEQQQNNQEGEEGDDGGGGYQQARQPW